ncbi:hypothetical protein [Pedobacter sp. UC225_65]|uniref:restriction endonuclease subunit S n=1 Tax=Pedobacter sp. UC225_65 TaxID=3350173 RepID=UPI00366FE413
MQSNYKRLGDYIREVKVKNTDLRATLLLGINIDKFFMPSVANVIGTDMATYRVVNKNQFGCNRMHVGRDYRIPIALSKRNEPFMVSPAYDVFEIIDPSFLMPEYLMMWFSRKEFDRNAWFHTDADVRGGLPWKLFCDLKLPIPSPEKQIEIVREYNIIQNRIKLNNKIITKLEKTAQTIYKQWFVDFEFPNEIGLPYKSNGGVMVESNLRKIPKGWSDAKLSKVVVSQYGYTASADYLIDGPKFLRITDISNDNIDWNSVPNCEITNKEFDKYALEAGDIVVARTGATVGFAKQINKLSPPAVFASYLVRLKIKNKKLFRYVGLSVVSQAYRDYILSVAGGSAQPQANAALMIDYNIVIPLGDIIDKVNKLINPIFDFQEVLQIENSKMIELKELILAKMTKIEMEKEFA